MGGETTGPLTSHGYPLLPPGSWKKGGKEEKDRKRKGKSHPLIGNTDTGKRLKVLLFKVRSLKFTSIHHGT